MSEVLPVPEYIRAAHDYLPPNSSDPFVWQMVDELDMKAAYFADPSSPTESDPSRYEQVKRFGMFLTIHQAALADWPINDGAFELKAGHEFIAVHIPPPDKDQPPISLGQARADYTQLADYIRRHDLNIEYVLGLTYRRLASTARRQNYTIVEGINLPTAVAAAARRVWDEFMAVPGSSKPPGEPTLVYHTKESFLAEFPAA